MIKSLRSIPRCSLRIFRSCTKSFENFEQNVRDVIKNTSKRVLVEKRRVCIDKVNRELETSLTITKQPVIARCKSRSRIFSRRITLITVAMNLDKKEVAITRRKSRPSLEQKLVYHSKQWHRLSRARIPACICSFRDERKKFLILLSFTKPVYKTINHRTSFLAAALDFFRLIKHVYTPDPRIIINFFRLKRNRIAAIRRINLFLFEREEKNLRLPSFLSSSITFSSYAKNYLPTFFLNGSAKFLEFTYVRKCTVNNHFWFANFLFSYNREMVKHI